MSRYQLSGWYVFTIKIIDVGLDATYINQYQIPKINAVDNENLRDLSDILYFASADFESGN